MQTIGRPEIDFSQLSNGGQYSDILDEFYNLLSDKNVEVATVKDRNDDNAQKIDKLKFQEQTFHKISQKKLAELLKDISWDERYEWLSYQKLKGNRLFTIGQYDQAIQVYMEACVGLDLDKSDQKKYLIMRDEFQVFLLNNLAMCYKKKKEFHKAYIFMDMSIKCNEESITTWIRRTQVYFEGGNMEEASRSLSKCQRLQQNYGNAETLQQILTLNGMFLDHHKQQRRIYKKMFQKDKSELQSESDEKTQLKQNQTEINNDDDEDEEAQEQNLGTFSKLVMYIKKIFLCRKLFVNDDDSIDQDEDERDHKSFF